MRVRWGALVALVAAVWAAVPAGALPLAATGNPTIISFYRAATAHTNAQPAEHEVVTGEYWLADDAATTSSGATFKLAWGVPRPSPSYVPATALVTIRQSRSRPQWEVWTFVRTCRSRQACTGSVVPVEFFVGKHGDEWGFRTGHVVACWNAARGSSHWIDRDWTLAPPWQVYGHFVSMTTSRARTTVTSTYPIAGGGTAREVDTIAASDLFVHAAIRDSATKHPAYPAHAYQVAVSYPKASGVTPPTRRSCPSS